MMSSFPLFSVLIANYNNGNFLRVAIESVLSQSYQNWEIVIVDDKSTDDSENVYYLYSSDERIRVYRNDANMGCGYTKYRCVELAHGQLCGFLDPDDILLPDALKIMVEVHQQHPEVSVVFSRFYICDDNMNVLSQNRELITPPGFNYFINKDYSPEHFASFKRDCYEKTVGISKEKPRAVDQDLYFKLEEIAPCYAINKFTYKYRLHSNNISKGQNANSAGFWNFIVRYETCIRRGLPLDVYLYPFYQDIILHYEGEVSKVKSGWAYRLGSIIVYPFSLLKRFFNN